MGMMPKMPLADLVEMVEIGLEEIGLKGFLKPYKDPGDQIFYLVRENVDAVWIGSWTLQFTFSDKEMSRGMKGIVDRLHEQIDPIIDAVKKSRVMAKQAEEIQKLKEELKAAVSEKYAMKKYKTYYDMQFAATHGKTTEGLKL